MNELIEAILRFQAPQLLSERNAIRLVVRARWPLGLRCPTCGRRCARERVRLICERGCGRATIFAGTPLQDLRRPCVRALLLALRAFAVTRRGLSARELSREVGAPRMTIWRHMHLLRTLLPRAPVAPTETAAAVELCHRTRRQPRGFAIVGARNCVRASLRPSRWPGDWPRLIAESVRTWLSGTHHGVTTRWLPFYLREAEARYAYPPDELLDRALPAFAAVVDA